MCTKRAGLAGNCAVWVCLIIFSVTDANLARANHHQSAPVDVAATAVACK